VADKGGHEAAVAAPGRLHQRRPAPLVGHLQQLGVVAEETLHLTAVAPGGSSVHHVRQPSTTLAAHPFARSSGGKYRKGASFNEVSTNFGPPVVLLAERHLRNEKPSRNDVIWNLQSCLYLTKQQRRTFDAASIFLYRPTFTLIFISFYSSSYILFSDHDHLCVNKKSTKRVPQENLFFLISAFVSITAQFVFYQINK